VSVLPCGISVGANCQRWIDLIAKILGQTLGSSEYDSSFTAHCSSAIVHLFRASYTMMLLSGFGLFSPLCLFPLSLRS
jgi:hypothetical protein